MLIFSHRGIISTESAPNSLAAFRDTFKRGFSLETDLRMMADGTVIISHDPIDDTKELSQAQKSENGAPKLALVIDIARKFLQSPQMVAFHIKVHTPELIEKACRIIGESIGWKHIFLFDLPLEELQPIKSKFPECRLAVSVGEKNYGHTIYTKKQVKPFLKFIDYIWADEWHHNLYEKDFFEWCRKHGKKVFIISPELHRAEHHPFADRPKERWAEIQPLTFDGICTNFPREARLFFINKIFTKTSDS